MFKKIELWVVILLCIIFFISLILYGGLLRYHYLGRTNFQNLQKIAVFLAEIPENIKNLNFRVTLGKQITLENKLDMPPTLHKHNDKPRFKRFVQEDRDALLVLPRYDGNLMRSVVEIIDLNTFEVLHTYKHDITSMNNLIDISNKEHSAVRVDDSEIRFEYRHPLILENGSLISDSDYAPLFKIDFCSNLLWINQEEQFHHSKNLDSRGNIWTASKMYPYSTFVSSYIEEYGFYDDAIAKVNQKGELIFIKSVVEILIENGIKKINILDVYDPIHLNDIEPAFENSKYWNKNDLFLSTPRLNAIIQYRPSTNKVIRYIQGKFFTQHDVDIISDKEISIFNNNNKISESSEYSEVLIYNFETETFSKKFNKQLQDNNFKTKSEGLAENLKDGSMLVEEQNYGRLIFFNKDGVKEWEFVNKDDNGNIHFISWSRIIENKNLIGKLKEKIKNKQCQN